MTEQKGPVTIEGDAGFVHTASKLIGRVKIGAQCIVHPLAQIDAGGGEIVIGPQCIIEENVQIINSSAGQTLKIGSQNIFNTGAIVRAVEVGDQNVFCPKCVIGDKVEVTNNCVFNPKVEYLQAGVVPPFSVLLADGSVRTTKSGPPSLESHCELLRTRMPKFGTAYKNKS